MSALFTALIGVFSGFLGGLAKSFVDRRRESDKELLAKRLTVYAELWQYTGILPLYPRDTSLTYAALAARSAQLCDWYFRNAGGLFLSRATQQRYVAFQAALAAAIVSGQNNPSEGDRVRPADYDAAREAGSQLRTSLTNDLNSRGGWRHV